MRVIYSFGFLQYDPEAHRLENAGFTASQHGDQLTAQEYYREALGLVPPDGLTDVAAQRASILSNLAFTHTQSGVAEADTSEFEAARNGLRSAVGETALLVSGLERPQFAAVGPHNTPKKPRRELFSRHAASLGLLARTASAQIMATGETPSATADLSYYGMAHDFARLGTDGHTRVSNAMHGARDDRRRGRNRLPHTAVWLARAGFGIVWSIKNDRASIKPAVRTIIENIGDIRTAETAKRAILQKP